MRPSSGWVGLEQGAGGRVMADVTQEERIVDPERTSEIKEVLTDGHFYWMMTFDQSLLILLQEGKITTEAAFQAVSSRHDFELAMQQAGLALPV